MITKIYRLLWSIFLLICVTASQQIKPSPFTSLWSGYFSVWINFFWELWDKSSFLFCQQKSSRLTAITIKKQIYRIIAHSAHLPSEQMEKVTISTNYYVKQHERFWETYICWFLRIYSLFCVGVGRKTIKKSIRWCRLCLNCSTHQLPRQHSTFHREVLGLEKVGRSWM